MFSKHPNIKSIIVNYDQHYIQYTKLVSTLRSISIRAYLGLEKVYFTRYKSKFGQGRTTPTLNFTYLKHCNDKTYIWKLAWGSNAALTKIELFLPFLAIYWTIEILNFEANCTIFLLNVPKLKFIYDEF